MNIKFIPVGIVAALSIFSAPAMANSACHSWTVAATASVESASDSFEGYRSILQSDSEHGLVRIRSHYYSEQSKAAGAVLDAIDACKTSDQSKVSKLAKLILIRDAEIKKAESMRSQYMP